MKKRFFRRKLKGMTLVEIIVALAIFTIMTSAMAMCAGTINKIVTENILFNRKMNEQRIVVDNMRDVTIGDADSDNIRGFNMTIVLKGSSYTFSTNENTAEEVHCENGLNFKYFNR